MAGIARRQDFHLQPPQGVKFHTGNELTAAEREVTWERAMALKGNPSFLFEGIKSIETLTTTPSWSRKRPPTRRSSPS